MSSGQFAFLYSPHIKSHGVLHIKSEHGPCVILSIVQNIDIKIEFPFPTHALQSEKVNILMPGPYIYGCRILSFCAWCEITQICNFAHVKKMSFRAWREITQICNFAHFENKQNMYTE